MAIKRLEDYNHDVEIEKEVLSSMPINNAKNLAIYHNKVKEIKEKHIADKAILYREIQRRSLGYLNYAPSERAETIKKELLGYKDLSLFNPINTAFEKMGFDTLLYSLTHYYKNDLASVNQDIREVFSKFALVGINLTEENFVYSNYARKYIKEFLKDDDNERMKDVFEDLHWKCPDVISHIETSLRILFDKNISLFEKYIENRKRELVIDNLSYNDFVLKRNNLARELYELENFDSKVIIHNFVDGDYMFNDYEPINLSRCYSKFLGDNCDLTVAKTKNDDLKRLLFNLEEYKSYLSYSYVLDDFKKKYNERSSNLGKTAEIKKEINAIIDELAKLTNEINNGGSTGFWIFKKSVDVEKNYLLINEKVKELDMKYEAYDNAMVYEKMNQCISDTSSIYDVFNFAFSFKGYLRNCIKEHEEDVDINKVKKIVGDFDDFLQNPNLNVLKNIPFSVDNNVAMIIMDHYKLLDININPESLTVDEINELIKYLTILVNNASLEKDGITMSFIFSIFESKKIIDAYK